MSIRIAAMLVLLLSGCAGQWVKVDDDRQLANDYFSAELPAGWIKVQIGDAWVVTRDGPTLQKILLRSSPHDEAFPNVELASAEDMLPSELAERYLADLRKEDADGMPSFELDSNQPFDLAGHEGFRVEAHYRTSDGLTYRLIGVGLVTEKGFISFTYTAPSIHFFEKYRPQYERLLNAVQAI